MAERESANFHPHSFRHTLTQLGQRVCRTPEEIKAWSQNLGHSQVMTTMMNYGEVPTHRQAEIIQGLGMTEDAEISLDFVVLQMKQLVRQNAKRNAD
jgi:hypothetical protein